MSEGSNQGTVTLPLQEHLGLDSHLQLVGHNLTVGIVLVFTVEEDRGPS